MRNIKFFVVIVSLILLSSCVEYEALPFDGVVLPRRSGYVNEVTNDWIYYNLETGDIFNGDKVNQHIKEGEQKNRLDWDIAFCGFVIRTNGGASGRGNGGVADLGKVDYESIQKVPENLTWVKDTGTVKVTMARREWVSYTVKHGITNVPWFDPNTGPKQVDTNANLLLSNAIVFSGPPPSFTPNFHTYIVRSGDGNNYFKLKIISWYNNNIEIGESGGRISFYYNRLSK